MEISKKICFTEKEFLILAKYAGIKQLVGFVSQKQNIDEGHLASTLLGLINKGFLVVENGEYRLALPIDSIFAGIGKADMIWEIIPFKQQFSACCIYFSRIAVLIEAEGNSGKYLKCSWGDKDAILRELLEMPLMYRQYLSDEILYCQQKIDDEDEKEGVIAYLEDEGYDNWSEVDIHTIIKTRNRAGEDMESTVFLIERPVRDVIVWKNPKKSKVFGYSIRKLNEVLTDIADKETM